MVRKQHSVLGRRTRYLQRKRIQMPAGAYLAAGLGPGYRASAMVACRHLHSRRYTHPNTKTDGYSNPQAYGYCDAETDSYTDAEAYSYRNPETDSNSNAKAYSHPDCDSNRSTPAPRWNSRTPEDH